MFLGSTGKGTPDEARRPQGMGLLNRSPRPRWGLRDEKPEPESARTRSNGSHTSKTDGRSKTHGPSWFGGERNTAQRKHPPYPLRYATVSPVQQFAPKHASGLDQARAENERAERGEAVDWRRRMKRCLPTRTDLD